MWRSITTRVSPSRLCTLEKQGSVLTFPARDAGLLSRLGIRFKAVLTDNGSAYHRVIAEGREDDYPDTWNLLFDAGGEARSNGILFDEGRTAPWKEGWIDLDISLGAQELERALVQIESARVL